MNFQELKHRLIEEGCSTTIYSIGYRDSDVYCLMNQESIWRVFYTERGQVQAPIFESTSEEAACEFFAFFPNRSVIFVPFESRE